MKKYKLSMVIMVIILLLSLTFLNNSISSKSLDAKENEKYFTYEEFSELIKDFNTNHSSIFNYSSLGKTYEGRDIWLIKISDNVDSIENEPRVLFKGGVHGDEKQAYQVVIYTIISFLENYSIKSQNAISNRIKKIINETELLFIPMINPDGIEAEIRKNLRINKCIFGDTIFRGVDINRNSGYKWELFDKKPLRFMFGAFPRSLLQTNVKHPFLDQFSIFGEGVYRGPSPFSEPESQAIKKVFENYTINISLDHHSYASTIVYGWGWTNEPQEDETLSYLICENISNITGYSIKRCSDNALVLGRIPDWEYANYGTISLLVELPGTQADGYIFKKMNKPLLPICENHVFLNIYIAEKAIELSKL